MLILGLNMFHADASAAIIADGKVVFAIAEERLNRIKHFAGFPALAVQACLDAAGATIRDVDYVAVGQDSDANLIKKVQYALANPAKVLNFIKLRQQKEAKRELRSLLGMALGVEASELRFREHHLEHHIAHIASAYYCSPWDKAAGFSYDGSGDFVSAMMARCEGNEIEVLERVYLPHSLGSFYTMICEFIGYKKYGDEGKVMGLAPYGEAVYKQVCTSCHAAGVAGSPKLGDKAAWDPRIKEGLATLVTHAVQGYKAMPAKGGGADLDPTEVARAVAWMADQAGASFKEPDAPAQ